MRYSLSQHPIIGRVFARNRNARGVGFADDLNIYASLKTALKVLVEMRPRLGENAKLSFNMTNVKIYIPGVTRERARERVLQHIEHDPSLQHIEHDPSRVCPLAHPNLSTRSCFPRPMPSSKMFKSFASSRTQKSITICCAFVNTRALHFSPETCLTS
jgi:hypothetical protein